jgi:hypothetical protein
MFVRFVLRAVGYNGNTANPFHNVGLQTKTKNAVVQYGQKRWLFETACACIVKLVVDESSHRIQARRRICPVAGPKQSKDVSACIFRSFSSYEESASVYFKAWS